MSDSDWFDKEEWTNLQLCGVVGVNHYTLMRWRQNGNPHLAGTNRARRIPRAQCLALFRSMVHPAQDHVALARAIATGQELTIKLGQASRLFNITPQTLKRHISTDPDSLKLTFAKSPDDSVGIPEVLWITLSSLLALFKTQANGSLEARQLAMDVLRGNETYYTSAELSRLAGRSSRSLVSVSASLLPYITFPSKLPRRAYPKHTTQLWLDAL